MTPKYGTEDPSKTAKMRNLLEAGYLGATFPRMKEYEWGFPREIPHRIVPLP